MVPALGLEAHVLTDTGQQLVHWCCTMCMDAVQWWENEPGVRPRQELACMGLAVSHCTQHISLSWKLMLAAGAAKPPTRHLPEQDAGWMYRMCKVLT